jgi:hypothetical protein
MHVRSRSVAAITAWLFFACGLLAMRHEAATPHVRDRAGGFVHAAGLTGHHAGHHSDIHGQRDPDAGTGECAVLTASHQAASAEIAAPVIAFAVGASSAPEALHVLDVTTITAVYRLAPKTSPPAV